MEEVKKFEDPILETSYRKRDDYNLLDLFICEKDNYNKRVLVRYFIIPPGLDLLEYEELKAKRSKEIKINNNWMLEERKRRNNIKPIPNYGDLFPLAEFISLCGNGFTDYDGWGNYSDGTVYFEDQVAIPSKILTGHVKLQYSHVLWFNR
jgi:hypothetical protein